MSPEPSQARAEELLAQTEWLRSLVHGIVLDADRADDVAQDTLLMALRQPDPLRHPRAWLAQVARNFAARLGRGEKRRRRREERAAHVEALPSAAESVEKMELQRAVSEAVLRLPEPYRSTVLLRYFEGLAVGEVAARTGVPVESARTRLRRGLATLRKRLDRQHGGTSGWAAPLLGLPGARELPTGAAATLIGEVIVMSGKLKVLGIAALLTAILGAVVFWIVWNPSSPLPANVAAKENAPEAAAGLHEESPPAEEQLLERIAAARPSTPTPVAPTGPALLVLGRAVDAAGRSVPGLRVRTEGGDDVGRATADANGEFAVSVPPGSASIVSDDPSFATVLAGSAQVGRSARSVVVVAAPIELTGVVSDGESRAPIAGALVRVRLANSFGANLGQLLDYSRQQHWDVVSAPDGTFALSGIPSVTDAQLHVTREGFAPFSEQVLLRPTRDRAVRLQRLLSSGLALRGIVVDRHGRTVDNALVSAGTQTTETDDFGQFELDWPEQLARVRLTALYRGHSPGVEELSHEEYEQSRRTIELRLGDTPLRVSGVVVDADLKPIAGARVWLADPTYFGPYRGTPQQIESLLGPEATELWTFVTTDARGRFEIGGLQSRAYRVSVLHPATHAVRNFENIQAGKEDLELMLPSDGRVLFEQVAGRVVTRQGVPVSGARVRLQRIAFEVTLPGGGMWDQPLVRETVRTDEQGKFEFRDVPREGMELGIEGDDILPTGVFLNKEDDVAHLAVTVGKRFHLQVRLSSPESADALEVHDAAGRRLLLRVIRGGPSRINRRHPIHGAESHILSVPETGTELVLFRNGVRKDSVPIQLVPGIVNIVMW